MIYGCIGRREVGKTTLGLYLISTLPARVIFDPRELYPTPTRATTGDDIRRGFDALAAEGRGELVITPAGNVSDAFEVLACELQSWVKSDGAPIGVLVDEERFVKDPPIDKIDAFDWVLRCATRANVTIVLTCHRPKDIPPDIRAIVDMWCLFQMTHPADLETVAEFADPATVDKLPTLAPHTFIAWDETKSVAIVRNNPRTWFSRLTITPTYAAST